MNRTQGILVRAVIVCSLLGSPALAVGPVDGEVGALWWNNDFDAELGSQNASASAGAPGFRGEVWLFEDYGMRAALFESDPDGAGDKTDYTSIDLMWKAFSPTENNYFAFGVGWEDADLAGIETSGARLSVEGSVGIITVLQAYGQASYLPSMDEFEATPEVSFEDMNGHELELGLAWNAAPLVNVRAGYRQTVMDFTEVDSLLAQKTDGSTESKGLLVGVGLRF